MKPRTSLSTSGNDSYARMKHRRFTLLLSSLWIFPLVLSRFVPFAAATHETSICGHEDCEKPSCAYEQIVTGTARYLQQIRSGLVSVPSPPTVSTQSGSPNCGPGVVEQSDIFWYEDTDDLLSRDHSIPEIIAFMVAAAFAPVTLTFTLLFGVLQAAIAFFLADRLQGPAIRYHQESGGQMHSEWRAAGMGVLTFLALGFISLNIAAILLAVMGAGG